MSSGGYRDPRATSVHRCPGSARRTLRPVSTTSHDLGLDLAFVLLHSLKIASGTGGQLGLPLRPHRAGQRSKDCLDVGQRPRLRLGSGSSGRLRSRPRGPVGRARPWPPTRRRPGRRGAARPAVPEVDHVPVVGEQVLAARRRARAAGDGHGQARQRSAAWREPSPPPRRVRRDGGTRSRARSKLSPRIRPGTGQWCSPLTRDAIHQSQPQYGLDTRSPSPARVSSSGAAQSTSGSASTATGGAASLVVLRPSSSRATMDDV